MAIESKPAVGGGQVVVPLTACVVVSTSHGPNFGPPLQHTSPNDLSFSLSHRSRTAKTTKNRGVPSLETSEVAAELTTWRV